jgi:hypothetical protein
VADVFLNRNAISEDTPDGPAKTKKFDAKQVHKNFVTISCVLILARLLAIAAVAITHEKRIGGTFVAHRAAKAASRKSSSHSFSSLLVRQFLKPLFQEIDDGHGGAPRSILRYALVSGLHTLLRYLRSSRSLGV